ncbi:Protein of unknown function [Gryllus bimaculatus]|nr:Protein of unknown function [Gryllus bimaculatus]
MLARVVNIIYQGELLNRICFKNVAYELPQSTANKKSHPWSILYTLFSQYRNMSKDGTNSDALFKDQVAKQFQKNVLIQIKPNFYHGSSLNNENLKKVNLKSKVLKRAIHHESGDEIFQQAKRNLQSCKILKKSGSGPKCLVEDKEHQKPFKKTVAFDLRPRVLHQCENPFQCTKIHCIKPCGHALVGILKKSKENISKNVFPKPYIIKKSIYCAIQSQARNFCQNRGENGSSSKIKIENREACLDNQDAPRKQIITQIPEKNALLNLPEMEKPPPLMEMKYIHPSFAQEIDHQANILKGKNNNILLKTISKSMNNLNTHNKSLVKAPAPIQTKEIYKLHKCRQQLCRVPSIARSDNQLAFSTSSGDYKDKNKCKSVSKRKRKGHPQCAKKRKSKANSSGDKCNPKNAEERAKVLECIPFKEETRDPEEIAKLLESCFSKSEKSNECDRKPQQTTCKDTTKDKQSKPLDKNRGTCDKLPVGKKPKCEKDEKKDNVIDVGCKSSLQKLCQKITKQLTEYTEKKKKMKKKKHVEPCEMTCLDVCADDGIMKDGEVPPGTKRDCRFVCDGQDPCDPPKPKKASKTNVCKEMFKKKRETKKKKCSKKPKKKVVKCSESEDKKKIRKKSSCADVCLWFQKAFRKKPQLYSGECEKPKKKSQRIKVCENSFKKMLRKMQKRKIYGN